MNNSTGSNLLLFTGADSWLHDRLPHRAKRDILFENGIIREVLPEGRIAHDPPPGTRIIRLPGGLLIPPFFDAHLHLEQGGKYLCRVKLLEVRDSGEVLRRVRQAAEDGGDDWIIGIGLNEHAWPSLPELYQAAAGKPLLIYTRDYHSVLLNPEGMKEIGLTASTQFPQGGYQDLDENGEPVGILHENAVTWIEEQLPPETEDQRLEYVRTAIDYLVTLGVLGVSNAGHEDDWGVLKRLIDDTALPLRVETWARCLHLSDLCFEMPRGIFGNLRRTRIKLFLDGSLGSRTAWMREPYTDRPEMHPGPVLDLDELNRFIDRGIESGWSFAIHAIGDAAVTELLNILHHKPAPAGAHRIEHVQHIEWTAIDHPAWDRVIPSLQPLHREEDIGMMARRIGKARTDLSYPAKSLWRENRPTALGSDWPVVEPDPLKMIHAAISPRTEGLSGMPGEEFTLPQALKGATRGSALAAGFSDVGELKTGTEADMVWLTIDPRDSIDAWLETRIGAVWRGAKLLHLDDESAAKIEGLKNGDEQPRPR